MPVILQNRYTSIRVDLEVYNALLSTKKVLEQAYKPKGHRKLQVTGPEVLAQILALQPPDPAAVLLGALGVNRSEVQRRLDAVTPHS